MGMDLKMRELFNSEAWLLFLLPLCFLFLSCSEGSEHKEDTAAAKPSNLSIAATIVGADSQNPYGDGSGQVHLKLLASNASSYKIVLGNGESKELSDGNLSYTYTTSGLNTYVLYVSAYNGGQFVSSSITIQVLVQSRLIWSDEFNTDGAVDGSKWNMQIWDPGNVNNELQSYTSRPENIIVQNGFLKIKAIREKYGKGDFTSARIESNGKFSFKYGKVVIRAKVPSGVGTWPAVWMLGSNIGSVGWPACGEIDILESVGKEPHINHSSLHSPGRSGSTPDTGTINVPTDNTAFHIYTADWSEKHIKFYVDDLLYYSFTNNASFPFNKDFFLIVNLAMGGNWGGTVDPSFTSSVLEVDYIRVYN